VNLPGTDGFDILARTGSTPGCGRSVIMLTAQSAARTCCAGSRGRQRYITKPFEHKP